MDFNQPVCNGLFHKTAIVKYKHYDSHILVKITKHSRRSDIDQLLVSKIFRNGLLKIDNRSSERPYHMCSACIMYCKAIPEIPSESESVSEADQGL